VIPSIDEKEWEESTILLAQAIGKTIKILFINLKKKGM